MSTELLKLDAEIAAKKLAIRSIKGDIEEFIEHMKEADDLRIKTEKYLAKLLAKREAEFPGVPMSRPLAKPKDLIGLDSSIAEARADVVKAEKRGNAAYILDCKEFLAELLADRAAVGDFQAWPLEEAA
jgi:hypothetical protein